MGQSDVITVEDNSNAPRHPPWGDLWCTCASWYVGAANREPALCYLPFVAPFLFYTPRKPLYVTVVFLERELNSDVDSTTELLCELFAS